MQQKSLMEVALLISQLAPKTIRIPKPFKIVRSALFLMIFLHDTLMASTAWKLLLVLNVYEVL